LHQVQVAYALIGKQVRILCGPAAVKAEGDYSSLRLQPLGNWEGQSPQNNCLSRKTCLYRKHR